MEIFVSYRGFFIINTDGRIQFGHYSKDPADHPDPKDIRMLL